MGRTKCFPPAGVEGGAVGRSIGSGAGGREGGGCVRSWLPLSNRSLAAAQPPEPEKFQPCGKATAGARLCKHVVVRVSSTCYQRAQNLEELLCSRLTFQRPPHPQEPNHQPL